MKRALILLISGVSFIILLSLTIRPVPMLPEDELTVKEGWVTEVYEAGEKDIVFTLEGTSELFYINRGLEQGLSIQGLQTKLIGNKVTLKYPEYWSLLSNGKSHHLSKVEANGETIFSELADRRVSSR